LSSVQHRANDGRRTMVASSAVGIALGAVRGADRTLMVKSKAVTARRASVVTRASADAAAPAPSPAPVEKTAFQKFSSAFSTLFPVWTVMSAVVGIKAPATFSFMQANMFTLCLATLMLSMGITLTLDDFKRVFSKPDVVGIGFLACYVMMPVTAMLVGNMMGLSGPLLAGLILVGSINGGQASNLCAYIARGDVALSVLMTTATTIGCIFMTPLICKFCLGAIVDVDAIGMAISTIQVVLMPIVLGVTLNKYVPKACRAVEPACPIIGVLMTIILVGASVATCAEPILNAGLKLQVAAFLLHAIGGAAGYWVMRALGYDETVCRTTAIETSMKSSAFGFLLATLHFPEFLVRVPSAVSVVWMAVMGSSMAVFWRMIPVKKDSETA
jgi:BASS family bile acid:Na+ symporter